MKGIVFSSVGAIFQLGLEHNSQSGVLAVVLNAEFSCAGVWQEGLKTGWCVLWRWACWLGSNGAFTAKDLGEDSESVQKGSLAKLLFPVWHLLHLFTFALILYLVALLLTLAQ